MNAEMGKISSQLNNVGVQISFRFKNSDIYEGINDSEVYICSKFLIMALKLTNIRKNYRKSKLIEGTFPENPFTLFESWFSAAVEIGEDEPNAMILSTVSNNKPSSRVVLLKEITEVGFVFFTNFKSRKGMEMADNPWVALNFYWPKSERQVRVEGCVSKVEDEISEVDFNSRPLESRIGAVISPQSEVIGSSVVLQTKFNAFLTQHIEPRRPMHWGGYSCAPEMIEFWQGGEHRLHDRIRFIHVDQVWSYARLAP